MALYPILHRWSTTPLVLVEAASFARALELAASRRVNLRNADLRGVTAPGISLEGAQLGGSDLSNAILPGARLHAAELRSIRAVGAFLQEAMLCRADLRAADLRRADLRAADLEKARLTGAELQGALFYGAKLNGAVLDWRWSGIPRELLRQGCEDGRQARDLEAKLATAHAERPFAWLKAILTLESTRDWAIQVLARHIRPGDNAPELLRRLAADVLPYSAVVASTQAASERLDPDATTSRWKSPPMLWTRRTGRGDTVIRRLG